MSDALSHGTEGERSATPRRRRWRDPQVWRLASGLVLFAFALTHFLNHALGHVSLGAMEAVQHVRADVWRSWPGTILLYGAAAVHIALALWKLVRRRTWRLAPWEIVQIALGLVIPFLIATHVATTRLHSSLNGGDDSYNVVLRSLWPDAALKQTLLLVIVWLHAMIGFHFWLRLKPWYAKWSPVLLVAAVILPTIAITGWIQGAREAELIHPGPPIPAEMMGARVALVGRVDEGVWAAFALLLISIIASRLWRRWRGGPTITYPGGRRVRATSGATLLEISRAAGVPHASVCGGRGRCTTCRVLVLEGADTLSPPNPHEAAALGRIHAPPAVRLACQVRPQHSLTIRPLIPLREVPGAGWDSYRWGVERRITVLFADLRSFTSLAERLYPYDAVFLLNRYFEVMSEAIERHGGEVDKFLGDGIMALFGIAPARGAGSRDALFAARDMMKALDGLNREFEATLAGQLRMGFGIHMGPAVLGRIGGGRKTGLTALGDSVNIASRLEGLNKEFGSTLVVSDAAMRVSGLTIEGAEMHEIAVRGRSEMLAVHVVKDLDAVAEAPRPLSVA